MAFAGGLGSFRARPLWRRLRWSHTYMLLPIPSPKGGVGPRQSKRLCRARRGARSGSQQQFSQLTAHCSLLKRSEFTPHSSRHTSTQQLTAHSTQAHKHTSTRFTAHGTWLTIHGSRLTAHRRRSSDRAVESRHLGMKTTKRYKLRRISRYA